MIKPFYATCFLLLVTSTLTFAQAIRLGQFDEIKVFDGIRVTVIPSQADSLVIEGKIKILYHIKIKTEGFTFA